MSDNSKLVLVRSTIRNAPSFPKLLTRVRSHLMSLSGPSGLNEHYKQELQRYFHEPESILHAHATVMNAKSQRAKTMHKLTDDIFKETGLPRLPEGKFRGEDTIDWKQV